MQQNIDDKEKNMFEVSDKASEVIKQFLEGKDSSSAVRITLMEGGWAGSSLGMALDEQHESDKLFNEKGVKFIIDTKLYEVTQPISVDFADSYTHLTLPTNYSV